MARILIVYGTTDGHTARVAEAIAMTVRKAGHETIVHPTDDLPDALDIESFNAIIVGASVHYGKFQRSVARFIRQHLTTLSKKPSAFFAVSGASSSGAQGREEARTFSDPFLKELNWAPRRIEQVAGAFPFTRYGWWKRMMMRYIVRRAGGEAHTRKDYAYTDWDRVSRFAEEFTAEAVQA